MTARPTLPPAPKAATPFTVWWSNSSFWSPEEFASEGEAVAYGKAKGFEFSVHEGSSRRLVAGWRVFGGLSRY